MTPPDRDRIYFPGERERLIKDIPHRLGQALRAAYWQSRVGAEVEVRDALHDRWLPASIIRVSGRHVVYGHSLLEYLPFNIAESMLRFSRGGSR